MKKATSTTVATICLLLIAGCPIAQTTLQPHTISFDNAFNIALQNNLQLRSADLQLQRGNALGRTGYAVPNTGVFVENEDINPTDKKGILKIGVAQSIEWPGLYKARRALLNEETKSLTFAKLIRAREIKRDVQSTYYTLWYYQNRQQLWRRLDSIYSSLTKAAVLRVRTGESAGLDSIAAQAKSREIFVQLQIVSRDIQTQQGLLKKYLNTDSLYLADSVPLTKVITDSADTAFSNHPVMQWQQQNIAIAVAQLNVAKQSRKPNFEGRFFTQRLYGITPPYSGFSVTAGIPIFGNGNYKNILKAAAIEQHYQQSVLDYQRLSITTEYNTAYQQLQKDTDLLQYYETTGLRQAEAIIKAANLMYRSGESSFADLSLYLTQAIDIQRNYLEVLNQYNQSAIQINYHVNK